MTTDDQLQALQELADDAQDNGMGYGPDVVMIYRYPDGTTQVRAPEINDPAFVIEMLEDGLRAMREGHPAQTN